MSEGTDGPRTDDDDGTDGGTDDDGRRGRTDGQRTITATEGHNGTDGQRAVGNDGTDDGTDGWEPWGEKLLRTPYAIGVTSTDCDLLS